MDDLSKTKELNQRCHSPSQAFIFCSSSTDSTATNGDDLLTADNHNLITSLIHVSTVTEDQLEGGNGKTDLN